MEGTQETAELKNTAPVHTHDYSIPIYTGEWVVDQEAWTETVNEPVYEMVEHTICSTCQADISGVAGQHLDEKKLMGDYSGLGRKEKETNTIIFIITKDKAVRMFCGHI